MKNQIKHSEGVMGLLHEKGNGLLKAGCFSFKSEDLLLRVRSESAGFTKMCLSRMVQGLLLV